MPTSHDWKRTIEGRASVLFSHAKSRCKDKNIELHLTQEWIREQLRRGTCELTGIPFNFDPPTNGLTRLPDAPSLDRISKHKPYTEDNTRVILWAVNCALAEYGTEVMLPILKAMIKGIEDAQKNRPAPVSGTDYREGEIYPELGSFSATGTWQDGNNPDNHCGADAREDANHCAQASSGDSVGYGSSKVGTSVPLESEQDNWHLHPTYGWIER